MCGACSLRHACVGRYTVLKEIKVLRSAVQFDRAPGISYTSGCRLPLQINASHAKPQGVVGELGDSSATGDSSKRRVSNGPAGGPTGCAWADGRELSHALLERCLPRLEVSLADCNGASCGLSSSARCLTAFAPGIAGNFAASSALTSLTSALTFHGVRHSNTSTVYPPDSQKNYE